ncbi:MAG: sortase, partial [Actinomycetota bacterium]|nr:sortase [Actinomycetota bacterium]
GFLFTKTPYVFYELEQLEPGDEIVVKDREHKEYTFRVYDSMTVQPEDFWVTYPIPDKTVISLQTCTPIPTFEDRLVIRGELKS